MSAERTPPVPRAGGVLGGERRRFAAFVLSGGLAAGVNVLSRIGFQVFMPYSAAIVCAFCLAMTTAFLLARRFVFETGSRPVGQQYLRFALVNLVALVQVWIISMGLAHGLFPALGMAWHPETVAHVIGVLSPVLTSFYAHKRFSFG